MSPARRDWLTSAAVGFAVAAAVVAGAALPYLAQRPKASQTSQTDASEGGEAVRTTQKGNAHSPSQISDTEG